VFSHNIPAAAAATIRSVVVAISSALDIKQGTKACVIVGVIVLCSALSICDPVNSSDQRVINSHLRFVKFSGDSNH